VRPLERGSGEVRYWQIANGYDGMDLSEIFIRLGVALLGPGGLGDFYDNQEKYEQQCTPFEYQILHAFCANVSVDDKIVLRNSHHEVLAAGLVKGPYRFEPIFDAVDIHGWDMQHCRSIAWVPVEPVSHSFAPNRFWSIADPRTQRLVDTALDSGQWA
jgi:predicted Mrr-cat superfamily restriction endonuclease